MRRAGIFVGIAAAALAAAWAGGPAEPAGARAESVATLAADDGRVVATIRRTGFGVPHIRAKDFESLAFGFGYAFAQDNICTIADSYVTVNGERSKFFGPEASWQFRGNGSSANNLNSDFFYKRINDSKIIERMVAQEPPHGPKPEIKQGVRGYVRGYNKYLRETGVDNIPDPRCRSQKWVREINEMDVYRRFYQLASLASQGVAIDGIGGAQPLAGGQASSAEARQQEALDELGPDSLRLPIGSNAYGLGKDATDNGRGMVLGNPHFPWDGAERLYQAQLTIPGKLNVSGGTLYGVPLVLIGSTNGLAWSHTVATAFRFTPMELTLAPGDQTSYLVDGRPEKMEKTTVEVEVKDGPPRKRTLYRTRYGPMFTSILGLPLFPWTPEKAFAMQDVNEQNFRYLNHFFDNNMAQSVREYDAVQKRYQGIPWVNSIAADSRGETYYSMEGAIPNVPNSKVQSCGGVLNEVTFRALGLPTLDGSRSECDWDDAPDAIANNILPPRRVPRLFRNDYTHNGNDSHWLSNPHQPLEGFDRIVGDERTARSLRTRLGLVMVAQRLAGSDGLPGNRFTLSALQEVSLNNRQYAGELWRDELVAMCKANPVLAGTTGPEDVSEACPVLEAWDVRDELDSRGAILFRRFATRALSGPLPVSAGPGPYRRQFDVGDPVNTPNGLNTEDPRVRSALADAVNDLRGAGIPLDAPLRANQYEKRGEERIPIHGGPGTVGVFNAINVSWRPPEGYGDVPHGTSFIMATQFTGGDCPVDMRTFVTYGNSESPESPHNSDYTRAFSEKRWNDVPYCEDEIAADPALRVTRIADGRAAQAEPEEERDSGRRDRRENGSDEGSDSGEAGDSAGGGDSGGRSLPFTGLVLGGLVLLGLVMLGGGGLLRRLSR